MTFPFPKKNRGNSLQTSSRTSGIFLRNNVFELTDHETFKLFMLLQRRPTLRSDLNCRSVVDYICRLETRDSIRFTTSIPARDSLLRRAPHGISASLSERVFGE
ncbi:hypothetical protein EVAR_64616_1 [Eumeta japonica]|uniref:Uncharacterized protein n=1 Tax=Eumeta variegata TaxID=151549 RepID=A0A4C1Z7M8_EUMVA|nr:hypothetical protein EVAR_64616_1 [Eumeta japonica]